MSALLDTSFFVATESGRPLGETEGATDTEVAAVESTRDPLPVDAEVARELARIVADRRAGGRRVPDLHALVAATAVVERIPVVTQDHDCGAIPGVDVIGV